MNATSPQFSQTVPSPSAAPEKKKAALTLFVVLQLITEDIDGSSATWQVVGSPVAASTGSHAVRMLTEQDVSLIGGSFQAIPARSWRTGDDVIKPTLKLSFA